MGNCATTPHNKLRHSSYDGGVITSPTSDCKDDEVVRKLLLSPFTTSAASNTEQSIGGEYSPVILTPPTRSRLLSDEIIENGASPKLKLKPPQSEETTLDTVSSRTMHTPKQQGVVTFAPNIEEVPSTLKEVQGKPSAANSIPKTYNLTESCLITVINIESKTSVDTASPQNDAQKQRDPCFVHAPIKDENVMSKVQQPEEVHIEESSDTPKTSHHITKQHQRLARIALVVILCFFIGLLGYVGIKAISSAKVLIVPPPNKVIGQSFGKLEDVLFVLMM